MNILTLTNILLMMASIFVIRGAYEYYVNWLLKARGADYVGIIEEKFTEPIKSASLHFVVVRFYLAETKYYYLFKQNVSPATYKVVKLTDQVAIRYLPENPNKARLWGIYRDNTKLINMIVVACIFILISAYTHWAI